MKDVRELELGLQVKSADPLPTQLSEQNHNKTRRTGIYRPPARWQAPKDSLSNLHKKAVRTPVVQMKKLCLVSNKTGMYLWE